MGKDGQKNLSRKSIYEYDFQDINGKKINMRKYEGKYILVVNVASRCGYTNQYASLQRLYEKYHDKLEIIGFPCNQFGWQEPGSQSEIKKFCQSKYGVSFTMANKIEVKGSNQHPIYQFLTKKAINGKKDVNVSWNFNKFLISPQGSWLAHFSSSVNPEGEEITHFLR